ncbi:hypothetical protein HanOQP8_Chr09g0338941 [Helianthus annuus]|nr:hypothetical protein HanOQP8_Chr09g0338941 [Helianthus annuus]
MIFSLLSLWLLPVPLLYVVSLWDFVCHYIVDGGGGAPSNFSGICTACDGGGDVLPRRFWWLMLFVLCCWCLFLTHVPSLSLVLKLLHVIQFLFFLL